MQIFKKDRNVSNKTMWELVMVVPDKLTVAIDSLATLGLRHPFGFV